MVPLFSATGDACLTIKSPIALASLEYQLQAIGLQSDDLLAVYEGQCLQMI